MARSRRRRGRRRASPRSSKRRPAPVNSRERGARASLARRRRRARARRARRRRCAGCARPGARARTSTGSSSSPRTTCGTSREPALEQLLHLGRGRERRVVVEVDVRARPRSAGAARSTVRSDSSPSTTSQPAPAPRVAAELRDLAADQERGVAPEPRRARRRSSPVVVVLPCAPATTIERCSETSSARNSAARARPGSTGQVGARDDRPPAVRRTTRLVARSSTGTPRSGGPGTASRRGPSRRPRRPRRAPAARSPTGRRRRSRRTRASGPQAAASGISSSAISSAASGRAARASPRAISSSRGRVAEQRAGEVGHAPELRLGHDDRAAGALEVARVLRLVVGGRERIRNEDRRLPAAASSQTRAARTRDHEIGGGERGAELVVNGSELVVVALHPPAQRFVVALAAQSAARPARPRRSVSTANSLSSARPAAAERRAAQARRRQLELPPALGLRDAAMRAGIGRPVTRYFGPSRPGIGNARKTRCANGAARRLASPRWASASISAAGMPLRARGVAPSARRHSRRRRARHPGGAASGSARTRRGRERRVSDRAHLRGPRPARAARDTRKVSSSNPASGTSRASARSGDPANVTVLRARAAPPPPRATAARGRPFPRPRSGT